MDSYCLSFERAGLSSTVPWCVPVIPLGISEQSTREAEEELAEAERHGNSKPCRSTYLKLQSSMVEIIKSAKLRCKEYRAHKSMYEEDMDSILDEDKIIDCSLRFVVQLLPSLFKENEQYLLVQSYEISSSSPHLSRR
ncbi:uncharacterized protein LOC123501976 [Portunus trituberculatus]|uniref:uncharacterized protein LOC123501976 n=1 Tax=Portunus trituberculatus TaxID=210409 RepID=UPI001E1D1D2F|nr:uncharacterized protein LOC123501976 [Portunus trituberculatus]XP_045107041.1 uncharacterized protein LOC123501976 [Portunus trituberculatus]